MNRAAPMHPRVGIVLAALGALIVVAACLHPRVSRILAPRELRLVGTLAAEVCTLDWQPAGGEPRRGYYLDARDLRGDDPGATFDQRYCLPWYDFADLRVSGPGPVRLTHAGVATRFLSLRLAERAAAWSDAPGGVIIAVPAQEWWVGWPLRVALAAVLGAAAFAVVAGFWRGSRWWDGVLGPGSFGWRGSRAWVIAAWALALAAPAWLLCWAPMLMEGDGAGYVWYGFLLWKNHTLSHFDGWRLPGYGVLLAPFIGLMPRYSTGVGVLQAVLGVATAWFVYDMLRRRIPRGWALLALVLVSIDPMVLMWQRYILSETLAAFEVTLLVWLLDRLLPWFLGRAGRRGARGLVLGVLLAGVSVAAIYTRANFQTFVIVVAGVLLAGAAAAGAFRAALVPTLVYVALTAAGVAPAFIHNSREIGRAQLIVGADHNRCVFAWQNETIDVNQTRALSLAEYRATRDALRDGSARVLRFTDMLMASDTIPLPQGTHYHVRRDVRSGVVVRESLARQPDLFAWRIAQGVPSVLGFFIRRPWYYSHTVDHMSRVLRGSFNESTWSNWDDAFGLDWFPPDIRAVLERHRHSVEAMRSSPNARVFKRAFDTYRYVRPVIIVGFLLGVVRLLRRGDLAMLAAGALILGNALAIALVQFTGMDRYGAPFYPLMAAAAFAGVLTPAPGRPWWWGPARGAG